MDYLLIKTSFYLNGLNINPELDNRNYTCKDVDYQKD